MPRWRVTLAFVPAIECIHWGSVGVRRCGDVAGSLLALWPEPVDFDACFEKAGFERFADSDDTWDHLLPASLPFSPDP